MTVVSQKHKKKARHPRGAGSAGPSRRTGQRAGRPEPVLGSYEHPVVSPQFSHLWQVPLRTVSHPQRGHGGASGVELSRIPRAGDGLAMVKFSVIGGGANEIIISRRYCSVSAPAMVLLVGVTPM